MDSNQFNEFRYLIKTQTKLFKEVDSKLELIISYLKSAAEAREAEKGKKK